MKILDERMSAYRQFLKTNKTEAFLVFSKKNLFCVWKPSLINEMREGNYYSLIKDYHVIVQKGSESKHTGNQFLTNQPIE